MNNKEALKFAKEQTHIFGGTMKEFMNFVIPLLEEKPQGEWLWLGDNPNPIHKWSCNKCGRGVKEQENFCPNCGADMLKGGTE